MDMIKPNLCSLLILVCCTCPLVTSQNEAYKLSKSPKCVTKQTRNHCYTLYKFQTMSFKTWHSAATFCTSIGQRLAVIPDSRTQAAVSTFSSKLQGYAWVAGSLSEDDTWTLVNGTAFNGSVSHSSEPDDHCAGLLRMNHSHYVLRAVSCATAARWGYGLCQHNKQDECAEDTLELDNVCYWVTPKGMSSWFDTQMACKAFHQDGDLAHLHLNDPQLLRYVEQSLPDLGIWVGIRRHPWLWTTGVAAPTVMDYYHWASLQGGNSDDNNCVYINFLAEGRWFEWPCSFERNNFLCEHVTIATTPAFTTRFHSTTARVITASQAEYVTDEPGISKYGMSTTSRYTTTVGQPATLYSLALKSEYIGAIVFSATFTFVVIVAVMIFLARKGRLKCTKRQQTPPITDTASEDKVDLWVTPTDITFGSKDSTMTGSLAISDVTDNAKSTVSNKKSMSKGRKHKKKMKNTVVEVHQVENVDTESSVSVGTKTKGKYTLGADDRLPDLLKQTETESPASASKLSSHVNSDEGDHERDSSNSLKTQQNARDKNAQQGWAFNAIFQY